MHRRKPRLNPLRRDVVLLHGRIDPRPFKDRQLEPVKFEEKDIEISFRFARGLVAVVKSGKFGEIKRCFESIFRRAEEHGLLVAVLVDQKDYKQVVKIRDADPDSSARIYYRKNVKQAAEDIAREYISPKQENEATIEYSEEVKKLGPEKELLLRRAFCDCTRILLEPLPEGKGSRGVFRVHVWRKGSPVGPKPLPFFAKFLSPNDRDKEWVNYRDCAELYIPFNLRPNLIRRRCVTGRTLAMLVGNFVEDAAPLRTALHDGWAGKAVINLFETTLRAFRLQPFAHAEGKKKLLPAFVARRTTCKDIDANIIKRSRELGLGKHPIQLEKDLCALAKDVEAWWGPIHGDLHDGNVMVRNGQGILIDMGSIREGPLTADPATLEASLVFRTYESDAFGDFESWRTFVDSLYQPFPIRPPNPDAERGKYTWLRHAVRDVRLMLLGYDCHDTEAAIVVACHLLRFARLPIENCPSGLSELAISRHAYALVTAERIIKKL